MDETKACPYCGEQVLAVAIKCKHCGSAIGPDAAAFSAIGSMASARQEEKPRTRRGFVIAGGVIIALVIAGTVYNYTRTGSISGSGFSDQDVTDAEAGIRKKYTDEHMKVTEVSMIRDSPTHMAGFVKLKVPLLGEITKNCSATWGAGGHYIWECK